MHSHQQLNARDKSLFFAYDYEHQLEQKTEKHKGTRQATQTPAPWKGEKSMDENNENKPAASDEPLDEFFDELVAKITQYHAEATTFWQPQDLDERVPIIKADDQRHIDWIEAQLAMRPDHLPSATGILNAEQDWANIGGRISEQAHPIPPLERPDIDGTNDGVRPPPVVAYDLADVEGVSRAEILGLAPSPISHEDAEQLLTDLYEYAQAEGVEVVIDTFPDSKKPPYVSGDAGLGIASFYVPEDNKITINPVLPQEHRPIVLLHELCHAHDVPLQIQRVMTQPISRGDVPAYFLGCEMVAELATLRVLENQGTSPMVESARNVLYIERELKKLSSYGVGVRRALGKRILETSEHIKNGLESTQPQEPTA